MSDTRALAPVKPTAVSKELADRAARYIRAAKSDNTLINYANAWQHFEAYCSAAHYPALPASPGAVVDYITHLADNGYKASTIQAKLAVGPALSAMAVIVNTLTKRRSSVAKRLALAAGA